MKILISGASGLVGSALNSYFVRQGDEVFKLIRTYKDRTSHEIAWDIQLGEIDKAALEGMDAVIHLAGENIASGRWTEKKKREILESRALGTHLLCKALSELRHPPATLISASAVGYYGNRGKEVLTEESEKGSGFLSDVCQAWEAATKPAIDKGIRVINLRTGVVLSSKGGILKKILPPFKLGLGGMVGSGEQYMSWIMMDDLVKIVVEALQNPSLIGPINVVAPHPVTNREFTKILGDLLHRPTWFRVPDFMARLVFGEMADEMLLSSTRAIPRALLERGFKFDYPHLKEALRYVL